MKKVPRSKKSVANNKDDARPVVKLNERGLPEHFRQYFWDCDFETVSWRKHKAEIVFRILVRGVFDDLMWIRNRAGDMWLRDWMTKRRGRGLDRPDVRFWGLLLKISPRVVTSWLNDESRGIWDRRTEPKSPDKTS